jgi:hypothetical protein
MTDHYESGTIDHGKDRMSAQAKRDAERLLREVPPDTRDLTSRICGDPVVGRRALDARRGR